MVLTRNQIERELKVIEKIDEMLLREKERTPLDRAGHEARQVRKQELLKMIHENSLKEW
jgi:hypothetical protein